jgi:hypothetical protein
VGDFENPIVKKGAPHEKIIYKKLYTPRGLGNQKDKGGVFHNKN